MWVNGSKILLRFDDHSVPYDRRVQKTKAVTGVMMTLGWYKIKSTTSLTAISKTIEGRVPVGAGS